ncbi:MAG TPA: TIGR04086 family membrane protein [candidate division Zixibacteria bacterium]|nr:TIGR04086 family membrane protein [candidate division Zixibacteria bacterium]
MQNDQRSPAALPPSIEPAGFFSGVKIVPIIAGIVVDIVATYVLAGAYLFYVVAEKAAEKGGFSEEAAAEFWATQEGLIASLVIGALGTAIGGYYAARRAGQLEIKHGALVGVGSILVGALMQLAGFDQSDLPQWYSTLAYLAAIPAGALGGYAAEGLKSFYPPGEGTGGGA